MAVTLRRRGTDQPLLTSEVSFRSAYIRTTDAPPMNSLVRLVFTLPPDDAKLTLSAHVTRVGVDEPGHDQYQGFVARFVGLDGAAKDRWEQLITWLRSEHGQSVRKSVTFARPSYIRLFQQKAPAVDDLWLRPASVEELQRLVRREIPTGTLFVPTEATSVPGANVTVRLVHPITLAVVPLAAVVLRRGDLPQTANGVRARLEPIGADLRAALEELAESVIVLEDYDVELYEEPAVAPR